MFAWKINILGAKFMKKETDNVRLTQLASAAGCGAKIGPKVLAEVVGKLPKFTDPMLLVGPETSDDAAVYKINDELAMIHTVDFFPPVVDDPYMYGQIAAANALSDVYAMGGVPKLALNVVAFPNCLGPEVLEEILRGGADKVMEAGAVLAGGHTINDKEPKYGLCVTGFVHPDKMWKNYGAEAGDILILTKPLGCGILNTAIKAEMASREEIERVQKVMAKLNKYAAEIALKYTIHSCTDVTGFSLAGHSLEMAKEYLNMGFYLGIGGVLTFNNAKKLKEVVAYMPLDRIVLETDCPYLSPVPNRGKRNSSLNLPYVVEEISRIKDVPAEQIIEITNRNAKQMYRLSL